MSVPCFVFVAVPSVCFYPQRSLKEAAFTPAALHAVRSSQQLGSL